MVENDLDKARHACFLMLRGNIFTEHQNKALQRVLEALGELLKHCSKEKPAKRNGYYVCRECGTIVDRKMKVCSECGKPIDWSGFIG